MLNIQVTAQALFDAGAMIVDSSLTRHLNTELVSTVNDAAFTHYGHRGLKGTNIHTGSPNGGTTMQVLKPPISQSEQKQTHFVEITCAIICDIPSAAFVDHIFREPFLINEGFG